VSALVLTLGATLIAGALGAVVRALVVARLPVHGISVVNLVGTALLALVLVLEGRAAVTAGTAFVVGVGFSGSLTTFSGWMGMLATRGVTRPLVTLLRDLLLPLAAAVALTVLVFATLAG
jgi:fluoride ion exporter CrcB/FEX